MRKGEKATPLVHFPKALKRPLNNAGPAVIGLLIMKRIGLLIRKGIGLQNYSCTPAIFGDVSCNV